MANDKKLPPDHDHWLIRPRNIRTMWIVLIGAMVAFVLAERAWHPHAHFSFEDIFAFGAWIGLLSGLALVIVTKTYAVLVKRKDTYYD